MEGTHTDAYPHGNSVSSSPGLAAASTVFQDDLLLVVEFKGSI